MKLTMQDLEVDNRDAETTELSFTLLSAGIDLKVVIEVTKSDLEDLIQNMEDNA